MKTCSLPLLSVLTLATQGRVQGQEQPPQTSVCPPNFLHLGHRCYYFSSDMATWHSAHFACGDRGSQLVALETQWEDYTIRSYLNRPEFASLNRWVDGIYNWSTRKWNWASSGQEMTYNGFLTPQFPQSSRWHCVHLSPTLQYRWNHLLCTTTMHYLCETSENRMADTNNATTNTS